MSSYSLTHLQELEAEAIYIIREVYAQFDNPAILFSGGKDSIVVAHLARKAFFPAKIPFPFVHIDTGHNFPEILISTPLEVCEQRDVKGLYAKARAGEISNFTGISAPFEAPGNPELDVPTHQMSIEEAAAMVVAYIIPKITGDDE